jgi:ParB-like chromosome segregation protein Spo0J
MQKTIEQWPLNRLIEYENNPRKNEHVIDKIATAITEFGFRVPVLAKSDGSVIDGHLRIKAARKLGMATVPVLLADDLTDDQVRAFRISVNRMAELADWNEDLLRTELLDLKGLEFNMEALGFDMTEIYKNEFLSAQDKINNETVGSYEKKEFIELICPQCARTFNIKNDN